MRVCTYIHTYIHTYISYVCVCVGACVHACVCACVRVCMCTCTFIYNYTYTAMHSCDLILENYSSCHSSVLRNKLKICDDLRLTNFNMKTAAYVSYVHVYQ